MRQDDVGRARRRSSRVTAARDLAAEAQSHADVRATFVKHALARLPLIGVLVITINLFVQVRGDIGLAVAVAQHLTFGGLLVVVLLNLAVYIMLGIMVAAMPLVFDRDYTFWTRVLGTAILVLLAAVLCYTASWLLLAALLVVLIVVGVLVLRTRKRPSPELDATAVRTLLGPATPPADTVLRSLWAEGRAMLRVVSPNPPPVTPTEAAMTPAPEPKTFAAVADEWNERVASIREPRGKSVTRLAFAGIIGFSALFGLNILTQPIRFSPLELVSISGSTPAPGFVLLQGSNGIFIPNPSGAAQFITAGDITSRVLCDDPPHWWSASVADLVSPELRSGVDCDAR